MNRSDGVQNGLDFESVHVEENASVRAAELSVSPFCTLNARERVFARRKHCSDGPRLHPSNADGAFARGKAAQVDLQNRCGYLRGEQETRVMTQSTETQTAFRRRAARGRSEQAPPRNPTTVLATTISPHPGQMAPSGVHGAGLNGPVHHFCKHLFLSTERQGAQPIRA